jgi:hypothetical protein
MPRRTTKRASRNVEKGTNLTLRKRDVRLTDNGSLEIFSGSTQMGNIGQKRSPMKRRILFGIAVSLLCVFQGSVFAEPLKVYILSGQSNMEGHAQVSTFGYIGKDPATAPMLEEMRGSDGAPRVCDKVWISYLTGSPDQGALGEGHGNLTAGYGSRSNPAEDGGKIGPEFTFGIYIHKLTNEPILIIKTAWGGKSLNTDFRPPSAGPYEFSEEQLDSFSKRGTDIDQAKAEKAEATGRYYRLMMEHVQHVLGDIERVCPVYDEEEGYEIAGFVWFQGWNDMCDGATYPDQNDPDRYALYSELMAHFIRDVRSDLNAPDMRFVIGVLGVGGTEEQVPFRKAMAAPASMPEFKGNVVAVETAPFWDFDIVEAQPRQGEYNRIIDTSHAMTAEGRIDMDSPWEGYWQPIDRTEPEDRTWRFISLDPERQDDKLSEYTDRRFRDITLPEKLENWIAPDFDNSHWTQGNAPIGKGEWKRGGRTVNNNSEWGEDEFLLMRTTFNVDNLDYAAYRLSILARQGFHVYLNGHKIHTYIWWKNEPYYRAIPLTDQETQYLKEGENVLAVYANDQYGRDADEQHYGSLDASIQGITHADQERLTEALGDVYSAEDREILSGASNAGYHYLGSAKIIGQIGKAFAEAMAE